MLATEVLSGKISVKFVIKRPGERGLLAGLTVLLGLCLDPDPHTPAKLPTRILADLRSEWF